MRKLSMLDVMNVQNTQCTTDATTVELDEKTMLFSHVFISISKKWKPAKLLAFDAVSIKVSIDPRLQNCRNHYQSWHTFCLPRILHKWITTSQKCRYSASTLEMIENQLNLISHWSLWDNSHLFCLCTYCVQGSVQVVHNNDLLRLNKSCKGFIHYIYVEQHALCYECFFHLWFLYSELCGSIFFLFNTSWKVSSNQELGQKRCEKISCQTSQASLGCTKRLLSKDAR